MSLRVVASGRQVTGTFTATIRFADNSAPVTDTSTIAGTRMQLP